MAGTAGMRRALAWGRQAFAGAGLAAVRLEPVPLPVRWEEGATLVEALEPTRIRVRSASSALSPPLTPAVEAELVAAGPGAPGSIVRNAERYRGRILLVALDEAESFDRLAVAQRDAMVAVREAARAGALAVLLISTRPRMLLYRHVNNVAGRIDPIPSAVVSRAEGLRLLRLLDAGTPVRLRLHIPNRIGEAYATANVVAEISGADLPDEIVLLGAHLDSWDLGTACQDNAVNVALVVHAARAIRAAGVQPRRTLRFVLFGGEELGLFGSIAYVARHRAELDRHVAAIVHDMGAGPLQGYSFGGREELLPALESVLDAAGLDSLRHTREAFFLSDNFTFILQGVPTLFGVQDTDDFYRIYHSEADTLDEVQIAAVRESAVAAAAATLGLANLEEPFGARLGGREVLDWLRREGLVRHLQFLEVWEAWRPLPRGTAEGAGGNSPADR